MINISELITDKDFAQPNGINVTRSVYEVVNHRPSVTEEELNVPGIITIGSDDSAELTETGNKNSEMLHVFTLVPLLPVGVSDDVNHIADIITFNGQKYQVVTCLNDGQYGFYRSDAKKIDTEVSVNE